MHFKQATNSQLSNFLPVYFSLCIPSSDHELHVIGDGLLLASFLRYESPELVYLIDDRERYAKFLSKDGQTYKMHIADDKLHYPLRCVVNRVPSLASQKPPVPEEYTKWLAKLEKHWSEV